MLQNHKLLYLDMYNNKADLNDRETVIENMFLFIIYNMYKDSWQFTAYVWVITGTQKCEKSYTNSIMIIFKFDSAKLWKCHYQYQSVPNNLLILGSNIHCDYC